MKPRRRTQSSLNRSKSWSNAPKRPEDFVGEDAIGSSINNPSLMGPSSSPLSTPSRKRHRPPQDLQTRENSIPLNGGRSLRKRSRVEYNYDQSKELEIGPLSPNQFIENQGATETIESFTLDSPRGPAGSDLQKKQIADFNQELTTPTPKHIESTYKTDTLTTERQDNEASYRKKKAGGSSELRFMPQTVDESPETLNSKTSVVATMNTTNGIESVDTQDSPTELILTPRDDKLLLSGYVLDQWSVYPKNNLSKVPLLTAVLNSNNQTSLTEKLSSISGPHNIEKRTSATYKVVDGSRSRESISISGTVTPGHMNRLSRRTSIQPTTAMGTREASPDHDPVSLEADNRIFRFRQLQVSDAIKDHFTDRDSITDGKLYSLLEAASNAMFELQNEYVALSAMIDDHENIQRRQEQDRTHEKEEERMTHPVIEKEFVPKGYRARMTENEREIYVTKQKDRMNADIYKYAYDSHGSKVGKQDPIGQRYDREETEIRRSLRNDPSKSKKGAELTDDSVTLGKRTRRPREIFDRSTNLSASSVSNEPSTAEQNQVLSGQDGPKTVGKRGRKRKVTSTSEPVVTEPVKIDRRRRQTLTNSSNGLQEAKFQDTKRLEADDEENMLPLKKRARRNKPVTTSEPSEETNHDAVQRRRSRRNTISRIAELDSGAEVYGHRDEFNSNNNEDSEDHENDSADFHTPTKNLRRRRVITLKAKSSSLPFPTHGEETVATADGSPGHQRRAVILKTAPTTINPPPAKTDERRRGRPRKHPKPDENTEKPVHLDTNVSREAPAPRKRGRKPTISLISKERSASPVALETAGHAAKEDPKYKKKGTKNRPEENSISQEDEETKSHLVGGTREGTPNPNTLPFTHQTTEYYREAPGEGTSFNGTSPYDQARNAYGHSAYTSEDLNTDTTYTQHQKQQQYQQYHHNMQVPDTSKMPHHFLSQDSQLPTNHRNAGMEVTFSITTPPTQSAPSTGFPNTPKDSTTPSFRSGGSLSRPRRYIFQDAPRQTPMSAGMGIMTLTHPLPPQNPSAARLGKGMPPTLLGKAGTDIPEGGPDEEEIDYSKMSKSQKMSFSMQQRWKSGSMASAVEKRKLTLAIKKLMREQNQKDGHPQHQTSTQSTLQHQQLPNNSHYTDMHDPNSSTLSHVQSHQDPHPHTHTHSLTPRLQTYGNTVAQIPPSPRHSSTNLYAPPAQPYPSGAPYGHVQSHHSIHTTHLGPQFHNHTSTQSPSGFSPNQSHDFGHAPIRQVSHLHHPSTNYAGSSGHVSRNDAAPYLPHVGNSQLPPLQIENSLLRDEDRLNPDSGVFPHTGPTHTSSTMHGANSSTVPGHPPSTPYQSSLGPLSHHPRPSLPPLQQQQRHSRHLPPPSSSSPPTSSRAPPNNNDSIPVPTPTYHYHDDPHQQDQRKEDNPKVPLHRSS